MGNHPRPIPPLLAECLDGVQTHCASCGGTLWQFKTLQRTLVTLVGVVQDQLTVRACHAATGPQPYRPLHPEVERHLALPRPACGLASSAQIGAWRSRLRATLPARAQSVLAIDGLHPHGVHEVLYRMEDRV